MRKRSIRKRWKVAGIYRFTKEEPFWQFDTHFYERDAVWEFDQDRLTCYTPSGRTVFSAPYAIFGIRLTIGNMEGYFMEPHGKSLYLCEIDLNSDSLAWQAIKLVPNK